MTEENSPPPRIGRPKSQTAESHAAIMDAVHELLQEMPAGKLTMEAVAKRAGVGKPTLYKWWPTKAALITAMFYERLVSDARPPEFATAEETLRARIRRLAREFNGFFGKVMAELITEGQTDPQVLRELCDRHISQRRVAGVAVIEQGKAAGEFAADVDSRLLIDALIGPIYFHLMTRCQPLTEPYIDALIDQVLRGARPAR